MELQALGKALKGDKVIWGIFIALCVVSVLEVFSASSTIVYKQQNHWAPILRHVAFLLIGLGGVLFLQRIPTRFFSILVFGVPVSAILLVIAMSFGENVNGAQRWLGVGAFTIQPSEFAKICLIGFIAFFLSRMSDKNEGWIFNTMIIAIAGTCLLIAPENLSTACLLFAVCFLMMFIGQVSIKRLAKLVGVCLIGLVLLVSTAALIPESFTKEYIPRLATWKARIERHGDDEVKIGDPEFKITDDNYQESHAKIAIANGGLLGFPGSGSERDVLPQAYSDFIYAIILEEMGLFGGLFVLMLYIALMLRCGILASKTDKKFPRYLILGAGLMITIQALANMAVAVGLVPVTGQPLPLISRGGTSTIITCAYFGIILACSSKFNEEEHEDVDEDIANLEVEDFTKVEVES